MSEPQVFDRIRDEIGKNDVLLFMKGTPVFPQCGFSAAVVEVLSELGVKFHGINILVDPELRDGIKQFSQWPTIPQLYVKGEFVGGCDIVREMAETLEKGDERALADYRARAPHARDAHPTDEHFLPLHVAYGAAGAGAHGRALHRSFTLGNLSMASYAFA